MRRAVNPLKVVEDVFAEFDSGVNVGVEEADLYKTAAKLDDGVLAERCEILSRRPKRIQKPLSNNVSLQSPQ